MIERAAAALIRAAVLAAILCAPVLILSPASSPAGVSLQSLFLALVGSGLVFVEYVARGPVLIEFRNIPPLNRLRAALLGVVVVVMAVCARGVDAATPLSQLLTRAGDALLGQVPASPLWKVWQGHLPIAESDNALIAAMFAATALSAVLSLLMLLCLALVMGFGQWPAQGQRINLWVALPTFQPRAGGDLPRKLRISGGFNLMLGAVMALSYPVVVGAAWALARPGVPIGAEGLIWVFAGWVIVPSFLVIRGLARLRFATMIAAQSVAARPPSGAPLAGLGGGSALSSDI